MTATTLEQLVAAKEIVVTCGSGGVGKTTTAAALGTMAAEAIGGRVLVLTVDPARTARDDDLLGRHQLLDGRRPVPHPAPHRRPHGSTILRMVAP